jgi:hypothetical protein
MQAAEEITEGISGRGACAGLGYRVEYKDEEQLQTVCDQYLLLVFEYDVVVRHAPRSGVVFECLQVLDVVVSRCYYTHGVKERAENR